MPDLATDVLTGDPDHPGLHNEERAEINDLRSRAADLETSEATAAAHIASTSNPHSVTKSQVGLANADNTSDANKPVSTATQAALDLKAALASPAFTGNPTATTQTAGNSTTRIATTAFVMGEVAAANTHIANTSNPHSVTKSQVGLANADNTSDANKPVSTATQTALDLKAPLASPALTGTPTAPTAAAATNTTQLATTAFVTTADGLLIPKSLADAKGDLIVASANDTFAKLGVGSNGQVLTADSAESTGVKWATPSGGGGGGGATSQEDLLRATSLTHQNMDPRNLTDTVAGTTGRLYGFAIYLEAGDVVNALTFARSSAVSGVTNHWFALLDSSYNLIAQSADATNGAWNNFQSKRLTMTTPYTVASSGVFYGCVSVTASTMGSLTGAQSVSNLVFGVTPILSFVSTQTGLTTPASLTTPVVPASFADTIWFGID